MCACLPVGEPLPDEGHGGGEAAPVGQGQVHDGEEDGRHGDHHGAEAVLSRDVWRCWDVKGGVDEY